MTRSDDLDLDHPHELRYGHAMRTRTLMQGSFRNGAVWRACDTPDSPVLARFMPGYDRAFVQAEEREDLAGFTRCLALNRELEGGRCGRFREQIVIVEHHGRLLAGANFFAQALDLPGEPLCTVALNYLFVEPIARGQGWARPMLQLVSRLAAKAVSRPKATPAIFMEIDDPVRTVRQPTIPSASPVWLAPATRLRIWAQLGARQIDHAYIQPALGAGGVADEHLLLAVMHYPKSEMTSVFLHDHLATFFAVSVLKGQPLSQCPQAQFQLEGLRRRGGELRLCALPTGI